MYVIVIRTGFCDYFVQSLHSGHLRVSTSLKHAVRFRSAEAARKCCRLPGEEPLWVKP